MASPVTALVTGGAGFIGSHLVERLLAEGLRVRVLDSLSSGRQANLAGAKGAELIVADVRDETAVRSAIDGCELVFHQAALTSVPRSLDEPREALSVNVEGTLTVLLAARAAGVRRLVLASSSSVYGAGAPLPSHEDGPTNPISPYAVGKLAAEGLCRSVSAASELETVVLRYFNVFGPRQDPASPYAAVVPRFLDAIASGRAPVMNGDGRQSRDFTYVSNVIDANLLAAGAPAAAGRTYNIACGGRTSVAELAALLAALMGADVRPEPGEARAGDVRHSQADITRARTELGYAPAVTLREGLRRCVQAAAAPLAA